MERNGSSRVERTRLTGPSGATTISGGDLRSILGLRSTWFSIGVLRLTGGGVIEEGQAKTASRAERNLGDVTLQRQERLGAVGRTSGRSQGSVNVSVRPATTTLFRLRSPAATTAAVKVTS